MQQNNNFSGLLLVDKPQNITSFSLVNIIKKKLKVKKAGHCGTLDPLATGLMLVLIGKATKQQNILTKHDKVYFAKIKLGIQTDTGDLEGKIVANSDYVNINIDQIKEVCKSFVGTQKQIPPMYSALKINGNKLCNLARKGIEVERSPRVITIYNIDVLDFNNTEFSIRVKCSSGTYIRTLAQDIGKKLNTCATLSCLRREEVDKYNVCDAISLEEIKKISDIDISKKILPVKNIDIINEEEIKNKLLDKYKNLEFEIFDEIDSTNIYANKICEDISCSKVIIANAQTNGCGRFGKAFYSPKDTGIYLTLILKENKKIEELFLITFLSAIAVCKSIKRVSNLVPSIKWINDVFVNGKKVCGILTQCKSNFKTKIAKDILVGVGINVTTDLFPKDIDDIATSLQLDNISRNRIIAEFINYFFELKNNLTLEEIVGEYKKNCCVLGKQISFIKNDITYNVTAIDINNDGNLVVKNADGTISILTYETIKIVL